MLVYCPEDVQTITISGDIGCYRGFVRFSDDKVYSFNETMDIPEEHEVIKWLYHHWNEIPWLTDSIKAAS